MYLLVMRSELSVTNSTETTLTIRPAAELSIHQNPAAAYLASLGTNSRRTMRESLASIARMLRHDLAGTTDEAAILSIEWHRLENAHLEAIRTRLAETLAPNTANKKLAALRGVLKKAWKLNLMSREEYERAVDVEPVRGERLKRGRDIDTGEIRAMFEQCRANNSIVGIRDAAMLALLYGAGLRRAEAAGLTFANWRAETGEIVLVGKGNKERALPLPDGTCRALNAWLAVRGTGAPEDPILCPLAKGGKIMYRPMTTQAVWKALQGLALKAGVARLSPHDFRRTYIGDLLDAGVDLSTAQKLAGHGDPKVTAGYDRRPEEARRNAVKKLHVPFVS